MTWQNNFQQFVFSKEMIKRAWIGAGIAVVILTVLILISGGTRLGTSVLWPLATTAIGGACGGAFYHVMGLVRQHGGWKLVLANISALLVYFVSCWLSLVFGLSVIGLWH